MASECCACGDAIRTDVSGRSRTPGAKARKKRADVKWCDDCWAQKNKHGISAQAVARQTGWVCALCFVPIDPTIEPPSPLSVTIDRIVPIRHGGGNDISNLQLAHRWCNSQKNVGTVERISKNLFYTQRWRKLSKQLRRERPTCEACGSAPSKCATHIVHPVDGGDPWDCDNLQALCLRCSNRKVGNDYRERASS